MNLAELATAAAAADPTSVAVRFGQNSLTYQAFVDEGARVAAGLGELGVRRGDRVMLFSDNTLEYLVIYHAVVRIGAIFAPVHASFQVGELAYVFDNAQPAVIIAQSHLWSRLERSANFPRSASLVQLGGPSDRADHIDYAELGRSGTVVEPVDVEPETPALICYTSGATDHPHPVARSHQTEIFNAQSYATVWNYQPRDVALVALPLSWAYGLTTLSQGLLHAGATIIVHKEFSPDAIISEVERSQVTLFAGTMSMYVALLNALRYRDADMSSLRHLYRGGEPVNIDALDALERRLGLRLTDAYAATETAPVLAVDATQSLHAPVGTAGRLIPGARIRIVDELGQDVRVGEVGEAWLGGTGRMLGYWREPELTRQRLTSDGWFRSGDLLRQGPDGFFFVMGRSSDIIIRNGARVAPAEVETAMVGLAGVAASAAIGVPDEEFGESIVAFVVAEPDCVVSADDIYVYLADRIARFKLPTHIIFVYELPSSMHAKTDRRALRALAMARLGIEHEHIGL